MGEYKRMDGRPDISGTVGYAFPVGFHPEGNDADQLGMTLRDYFAAKAMQTLLIDSRSIIGIPEASYAFADAMLAARGNV